MIKQTIQQRRGTAALWTSTNPILASGEWGIETDTLKFKLGDGTTRWNALGYAASGAISQYTDAMARAAISSTVTGLTYTALSGILSLAVGYVIPTTTEQSNWASAYSASHARQHAITSTSDHTSSATSGKMLKADASGLPIDASNTDTEVSGAVSASHAQSHDFLSADHSDTTAATPVLGDTVYSDGTPKWTKLAGNTTVTQKFLSQTGDGSISAVPSWQTVPSQGNLVYYMTNTNSDVSGKYKLTTTQKPAKVELDYPGITSTPSIMKTWITEPGFPGILFIPAGQYEVHVHLSNVGGGSMTAYGELWEVDASGVDIVKIGTTETTYVQSGAYILNTEKEYKLFFTDSDTYTMASIASRIVLKLYGYGNSGTHQIEVYVGGAADSHISLPSATVDATNFVPYIGATADISLGGTFQVVSLAAPAANGEALRQTATSTELTVDAAVSASHARSHSITSSSDHTGNAGASGYMLQGDVGGLPVIATNTNAEVSSAVSASHAAITLDTNADTLLSLSTQALGLDTQVANKVLSGPVTGIPAVPTFRTLVTGDIPDLSGTYTPIAHKTTEDAINGLVKVNGAGSYSAVTDSSTAWNSAASASHTQNTDTHMGTVDQDIAMGTHKLTGLSVPVNPGDSIRATASITEATLGSTISASHAAATVTDTNSINMSIGGQAISGDLVTQNTTEINLSVDASGLKANLNNDAIKDTMIDWGTGANQVSAVDVPIADAGGYFATDNVEAALQQVAVPGAMNPVGTILLWPTKVAPTGYLLCYGGVVLKESYPALVAVIQPTIGTCTISNSVATGLPALVTLNGHGLETGDQIYFTTTGTLTPNLSLTSYYYVIYVNANTFNLALSRANALTGTKISTVDYGSGVHTCIFAPYNYTQSATSTYFDLPYMEGRVPAGRAQTGTTFKNLGIYTGTEGHALITAEMAAHTHTIGFNLDGSDLVAYGNIYLATAASGSTFGLKDTGAYGKYTPDNGLTTSVGSGTAHNNIQPTIVLNYIIKY